MRKVTIFGLLFSPNVGDGVIAECLRSQIETFDPGVQVIHVDISGRTSFDAVTVKHRSLTLSVLRILPPPIARMLVRYRLGRVLDVAEPHWCAAASGADLAIIGGGQIFSDADLNFCLKIDRVSRILAETGCPVRVHAAGVARNWSVPGQILFRSLLECDLRSVGLRDCLSIDAWKEQMGEGGVAPVLTRDPALLASETYPMGGRAGDRIGLCVTDPSILSYHSDGQRAVIRRTDFFADIAIYLLDLGHRLTLFCNGAFEDRSALEVLQSHPGIASAVQHGDIMIAPAPRTPSELAVCIEGVSAIVAHRLHACILGYAFQRPIVGLGWDRKLESFFQSVELEDCFLPAADLTPKHVAERLRIALAKGIDRQKHLQVLEETRAAIRDHLVSNVRS